MTASGWRSKVTTVAIRPRSRAAFDSHADDELVAGVHAVEGAEGDAARPPRRGGKVGHDLHQSITSGRRPGPSSSGP